MKKSTLAEFLKDLKGLEKDFYNLQKYFELDHEASCPCFSSKLLIDDKLFKVHGSCWRVSNEGQELRIYSELPQKTTILLANKIKKILDKQKWYNPYTIIYETKNTRL